VRNRRKEERLEHAQLRDPTNKSHERMREKEREENGKASKERRRKLFFANE